MPIAALIYVSTLVPLLAADTNGLPEVLPSSLKPPRPEIFPTFWEQYGAWIVFAGVLLLGAVIFAVWLKTRPKPPTPVPLAVQARLELEPLRQQPENGLVLSRSSQILRRYISAAFSLAVEEATTSQFCRELQSCDKTGPELAGQIGDFLQQCDLRKFAPSAPQTPFGAVARALNIIESADRRLVELNRAAAMPVELERSGAPK